MFLINREHRFPLSILYLPSRRRASPDSACAGINSDSTQSLNLRSTRLDSLPDSLLLTPVPHRRPIITPDSHPPSNRNKFSANPHIAYPAPSCATGPSLPWPHHPQFPSLLTFHYHRAPEYRLAVLRETGESSRQKNDIMRLTPDNLFYVRTDVHDTKIPPHDDSAMTDSDSKSLPRSWPQQKPVHYAYDAVAERTQRLMLQKTLVNGVHQDRFPNGDEYYEPVRNRRLRLFSHQVQPRHPRPPPPFASSSPLHCCGLSPNATVYNVFPSEDEATSHGAPLSPHSPATHHAQDEQPLCRSHNSSNLSEAMNSWGLCTSTTS